MMIVKQFKLPNESKELITLNLYNINGDNAPKAFYIRHTARYLRTMTYQNKGTGQILFDTLILAYIFRHRYAGILIYFNFLHKKKKIS